MEPRRRSTAGEKHNQGIAWPWFQLTLRGGDPVLRGQSRGQLSPHLLNLRPAQLAAQNAPAVRASQRARVQGFDFAHRAVSLASFVPRPLPELLHRYPGLSRLTITMCLDVLWCAAGTLFSFVAYLYLRAAYGLAPVIGAVAEDLRTYVGAVGAVITAPQRLLSVRPPLEAEVATGTFVRYGFRSAAWFALVSLLVILPVKGIATLNEASARQAALLTQAREATTQLQDGGDLFVQGDTLQAQARFTLASERFSAARLQLGSTSERFLRFMDAIPGVPAKVSSASRLLAASSAVAEAAAQAAAAWSAVSGDGVTPDESFAALEAGTLGVQPHLRQALEQLRGVDPALVPAELRPQLTSFLTELDAVEQLLAGAFELPVLLRKLAGGEQPQRYLVLFQNPSELRPTGGFAGSLAFVELNRGQVVKLEVPGGGPYDFQAGLKRVIQPPEPIRISRGTWQLQDATWFFDFPTSARKVLWFLRESGGPEVDGVIAINADVAAALLGITGPIELPSYRKVLTQDNFVRETQEAVELEFDVVANRPKQFIADLAPELLQRVVALRGAKQLELVQLLEQSLAQRSIQLYLTDPELQATARSFGWGGEVQAAPLDYLAVVRTNIGGGKTDAVTDDQLRYQVEVLPSGDLVAHLRFTRHHHGDPRDVFEWRRNQSYVRFYVPEGSELITAEGFTPPPDEHLRDVPKGAVADDDLLQVEQNPTIHRATGVRITREFGKTVFAHWLNVMPGEERTATLSYRLPFSLAPGSGVQDLRRYALYVQRQGGVRPIDFSASLMLPTGWRVRWQESGSPLALEPGSITVKSTLEQDVSYGVLLERLGE